MKKFLFALVLLASFESYSQKRTCATMDVHTRNQALLKEQFANGQRQIKQSFSKSAQFGKRVNAVYNIPVIVHVISDGETIGTGRNISVAQIQSQIDVLNQDFRNSNPDKNSIPEPFKPFQADVQLNFCLAAIDKNGQVMPEPGIDRINRNNFNWKAAPYDFEYIDSAIKPATFWDPSNYLNIWVINIDDDVLGYAQFPNNNAQLEGIDPVGGLAKTDGVVVDYRSFGTNGTAAAPYNKGRTATHEMGHFFGLRHLWGDEDCGNDFCNDTPVQQDGNSGCPTFPHISCSNSPNGDMFMNFMDYTDDRCMFMFTHDQKARIQAVMSANTPRRSSLGVSTVCNTTAIPAANFTFSPVNIVAGTTVTFRDASTGNPSSWLWNFGGGANINTSTEKNPVATFNTPGTYNITLTATNNNGNNTVTKTIIVTAFKCADSLTNFKGSPAVYVLTPPGEGYLSGHNNFLDKSKADKFKNSGPAIKLTELHYYFAVAKGTGNITATIWRANGSGETPGSILFNQVLPISSLKINGEPTIVKLPAPLTINEDFFVGIKINYAAGDTVALFTNSRNDATTNTAWEQWEDDDWYEYDEPESWNEVLNHKISVLFDNRVQPATTAATICNNADVTNTATFTDASCGVLLALVPSGSSMVSGTVSTCVRTQNNVLTFSGKPFVRRYFDVTPSSNASTSTGTLTLYFRDEDFVNYNSNRGSNPPLPTLATGGNTDPARINLIVRQEHGTSSTGQPGTYSGTTFEQFPGVDKVRWNASLQVWEVTFNVSGFSGFFIHSGTSVLPITVEYFKGQKQGTINTLSWKSNCLSTSVNFEIERSTNGRNFSAIGTINATQARCALPFDFSDAHPLPGTNYYRLKMTEADGHLSYSKIITLFTKNSGIEIVSLVPTLVDNGKALLNISSAKEAKLELQISDVQGRIVQRISTTLQSGYNNITLNVGNLSTGTYNLTGYSEDGKTKTMRFVKQ